MNSKLEEAVRRLKLLPEHQQQEIADILFEVLDTGSENVVLAPDQIAEVERSLSDQEPYATEAEVEAVYSHLTR